MLGPKLVGRNGVSLVPPTLNDYQLRLSWVVVPEVGRFWGPRFGELTDERQEKRFKDTAESDTEIEWTIAYEDEPVGFTGIFGIDWVRRDGESGIFIGRHDLYGRGIASEAVRLRTAFAWNQLRLHRVHNWIAHANRGSRRANEKSGYKQMGLQPRAFFRSGEWYDEWLGEAFPHTFPEKA
ncbi:MAG TPA: GNAT family N-acetyltransferase [Candidatus Limnocylindria bacterium]|jgi:RimJ/RimL family protein N-acetyltransferase|nr:GNAT family N-acetyltransferase [Candidatus Limnocylindria bacterium]